MVESSLIPEVPSVRDLLDAGVHFGHQSKRWNPKMKRFIFAKKNGICIIDLPKTQLLLKLARQFLYDTVASGKSVLFVGTKRQCQELVKESATRCAQHYVINRWLGGTLTNFLNINSSVARMGEIEQMEKDGEFEKLPMKEVSRLKHELSRLQKNLSGLASMKALPGAMVVIDVTREKIAVQEANRLGIPVVAMIDTNCDPDPIDYPIPANDDGVRSVKIVLETLVSAVIKAGEEYGRIAAEEAAKRQAEAEAAQSAEQAASQPSARDGEARSRPSRQGSRSGAGRERRPRDKGRQEPRGKTEAKNAAAPAADDAASAPKQA